MRSNKKRWIGLGLALALGLASGLFVLVAPVSREPALPNPNGYDLVRQATEMVNPRGKEFFMTMSEAELSAIGRNQQAALDLARRGLALPARVPPLASMADWDKRSDVWSRWWELSQLFVREGRLAELRGDFRAAARSYADMARLGPAISRGGTVADLNAGHGVAYEGALRLASIRTNLAAADCRAAADTLNEQLALFPTLAENQANEEVFFWRLANIRTKVLFVIARKAGRRKQDGADAFLRESAAEKLALIQKITDLLAARVTKLERRPDR